MVEKFHGNPFDLIDLKPDDRSHIALKEHKCCRDQCSQKPCTYICPTEVYIWNTFAHRIEVNYRRCVECGACILACPNGNILWEYPRPGYGVTYHHG